METKKFVPEAEHDTPNAQWSGGNYYLTNEGWKKISGKKVPEGISGVVLGPNGEVIGWQNNEIRIVLNEGTTELDEHGWPPEGSPAAKLWDAAKQLDNEHYIQKEKEYFSDPEKVAHEIKDLRQAMQNLKRNNQQLKLIALHLTELIQFINFPPDYTDEGGKAKSGNEEARHRLDSIKKALKKLNIKI